MSDHQFWHKDSAGKEAPKSLAHKTYFHPKTTRLYQTSGVIFDAERERWMIAYKPVDRSEHGDDITYVHLPEDFTRIEANGLPRFIEVQGRG